MCLMCSGCGRCLEKMKGFNQRKCLCCGTVVPENETFCPKCGMYIRPKAGARKKVVKKPQPPEAVAASTSSDTDSK